MKILQVWEWAGIASIMSHYLKKAGHECLVLKSQDYFGYLPFYGQKLITRTDYFRLVLELPKEYDVIHVHADIKTALNIRKAYPDKKIIFEYHGTEARRGNDLNLALIKRDMDHVFYSTKDLEKYIPYGEHLPNITDVEHFSKRELGEGALAIISGGMNIELARSIVKKLNLDVRIIVRDLKACTQYNDMPELLSKYDTYVDLKVVDALSATALQALAMGLKVIQTNGRVVTQMQEQHKPEKVIKRLLEVYQS